MEAQAQSRDVVELYPTTLAFLLAGITSYAAGISFLHKNPELRPLRKRRRLAWTYEEILRLQNAFWKHPTATRRSNPIDNVIRRALGA